MKPTLAMKVRPDGSNAVLLTYVIDDGRRAVAEMYTEDGVRKHRYFVVAADVKSATEYLSCHTCNAMKAEGQTPSKPPFSESDLHNVLERLSGARHAFGSFVFVEAPGFPTKQWVLNPPLPASEAGVEGDGDEDEDHEND